MQTRVVWFGLLVATAAGWFGWRARPMVLDAVEASYHEDAPGARPIAALGARLRTLAGQRWLELDVAARGPRVVPLPGLEGVHGVNLKTAQELHRLLRDDRLRMTVRDGAGRPLGGGTVAAVRRERLPARRLLAHGDVDLHALTEAEWPAVVTVHSDPLPTSAASFELVVDGIPRLRVSVDGERIAAIESLGEPMVPLVRAHDGDGPSAGGRKS